LQPDFDAMSYFDVLLQLLLMMGSLFTPTKTLVKNLTHLFTPTKKS
jgi:hypothetical protein